MQAGSRNDDQTIGLSWMPHQHNMSLIAQIVAIVHLGATGIGIAPDGFTKNPMLWLEVASRVRATTTGAPYWAFTSCVERSSPAERAALDLSALVGAAGGVQSTAPAEMRAFAEAFAVAGFRPEAFLTGYGLAEATSGVSGSAGSTVPTVASLHRAALVGGRVVDSAPGDPATVDILSSGVPHAGQRIVVVDPQTYQECEVDEVGEIWVTGSNVAQGYWRRPEETRETFGGYLADTGEGPFLRTGDLGFLRDGELFVIGRCKDLITIGGSKHYPDVIEATVQAAHSALLAGRGAAFAVQSDEELLPGQLIVAQEVDLPSVGEAELSEIADAVQAAVSARCGIPVASLLLVSAGGLPSTAIGKIQRDQCRQLSRDGALETLAEWHAAERRPGGNARHRGEAIFWSDLAAARTRRERETR